MAGHYTPRTLVFTFLLLLQLTGAEGDNCSMTSACVFDCGDQVMNMAALKTYRFSNVPDSKKQMYFSYSPCSTFSEGMGCLNTHVCLENKNIKFDTTNVGSTFSWSLSPHGGNNIFTYTHTPLLGERRETKVTVQCAPPNKMDVPTLKVQGRDPIKDNLYEMTLISQHACFQSKTIPTTHVTTHVTTHKPNVTTAHTTHVTTHKPNVTTANTTHVTTHKPNVTTAHTTHVTTHKPNATTHKDHTTTPKHNVTTEVTTEVSTHKTTHLTTPITTGNATTQNSTTHITTPTTANLTTTHMTTPSKNLTTTAHVITTGANITSHGPSHHTTPAHLTTTPASGASELVTSPGKTMVVLLMAMMTMLASV